MTGSKKIHAFEQAVRTREKALKCSDAMRSSASAHAWLISSDGHRSSGGTLLARRHLAYILHSSMPLHGFTESSMSAIAPTLTVARRVSKAVAFLLCVFLQYSLTGCHSNTSQETLPSVGAGLDSSASKAYDSVTANTKLAPDFELLDINGSLHHLSDYRGKVVVLNFWATWCPPCRAEIPAFGEIQDSLDASVQFVGIALDDGGSTVVKPWVIAHSVLYPILLTDSAVEASYGPITDIPITFFIDKKGRIRSSVVGSRSKSALLNILSPLIAEK
jgi:cytochrome c biogenesis protein CcmG/thiol:disulfide interchange protein DsbE